MLETAAATPLLVGTPIADQLALANSHKRSYCV